jgi:hypothetical protein
MVSLGLTSHNGSYNQKTSAPLKDAIIAQMKLTDYIPVNHDDNYWTHDIPIATARFPYYRNEPRMVQGKIHVSEEHIYTSIVREIVPLSSKSGTRNYVSLHPYVIEPQMVINVGMYAKPKHYADQESAIGKVLSSEVKGLRQHVIGSAQAWYYPKDKLLVIWECFFDDRFRNHPLPEDANMQQLWQAFERFLIQKFPQASTLATPFHDPIADSIEEYQAFLKILGYSPFVQGVYGKKVR